MSTSSVSLSSAGTQPAASTTSTSSSNSNTAATDYQSMFMQLLSTELQSQDPTQTIDPTTMVTQMVEINQLSDVAGIYSILQGQSGASQAAGTAAAAVNNPVQPGTTQSSGSAASITGGN